MSPAHRSPCSLRSLLTALIFSAVLFIPHVGTSAATFDLTVCDPDPLVNRDALQAAVDEANRNGQADTITLASGCTYTLSASLTLAADGRNALTINGNGATVRRSAAATTFGIFRVSSGATVTLINLTITGGEAGSTPGGGINNNGTLTLINSTVRGNSAVLGGGIFNQDTLTVTNSTISSNSATDGGGIFNFSTGTLRLNNSIVANSTAGGDCTHNGGTINAIHSLIEDGLDCITGKSVKNLIGDPALEFSLIPQIGSVVIDAADPTLCPAADFNGAVRPIDGDGDGRAICDIGAFEAALHLPIVTITIGGIDSGTVTEGNTVMFTLTRTGAPTADLITSLLLTPGTALDAGDYTLTGGSLSGRTGAVTAIIPAGEASVDLTFTALNDGASAEADEPLTAALIADSAYNLGTTSSATAVIAANGLVVTTGDDSGTGSLRQAIANANTDTVDSTITFNEVSTVTLTSGRLAVQNNGTLTILGGGVTVQRSGETEFGLLRVNSGAAVTLINLTITGGDAGSSSAGGIFNDGTLTVINSLISDNFASIGGGINNNGMLTVINSTFNANRSGQGSGINNTGILTVINSAISANRGRYGSGIFNDGTVTVINSIINANSATEGGGIFNSGTLMLINSTVSGNRAANFAGGILNGADIDTTLTLYNSIIANTSDGRDCLTHTERITISHSLIEDGTCGITAGLNGNQTGDPRLDANLVPLPDSPVIDAADPTLCPAADFNGAARPIDGDGDGRAICDIGAFEYQPDP